ncbi:MAG: glucose 1-dehydrogenase [Octadecabacter sp.]|jgi:NAD(P)-dependent dehydrogenase (short-subunit alcohol dehydrogenase family)|tara:strand:- start:2302 stop:3051 length:750 start_codon:yes stop_codon:yes gene_type:complete
MIKQGERGMGKLDGKTALVTGAGRGIGKAIADRFAQEGARVARMDLAHSTSDGDLILTVDVSDETAVQRAVSETQAAFGRIDILVNNAAADNSQTPVGDLTLDEWRRTIDVNLTGVFLLSRAVIRMMRKTGAGVIINVASQLGSVAVRNKAAYCASKGGVLQLTRAMALDHADDNIRVNSLSPGAVMTERLTNLYGSEEAASDALARFHPIGHIGLPSDVAGGAVFLASDDARFMTGSNLVIDGGYLAQ